MILTKLLFKSTSAPRVPLAVFRRCLHLLCELREIVPDPAPLTGREGPIIGYLFEEGPIIVWRVTKAMRREPALFSGFPDPGPLAEQQLRAQGWWTVSRFLQVLADRAAILYRLEQAGATSQALQILRQARDNARRRFASREDHLRAQVLRLATKALLDWQRRKGGRGA